MHDTGGGATLVAPLRDVPPARTAYRAGAQTTDGAARPLASGLGSYPPAVAAVHGQAYRASREPVHPLDRNCVPQRRAERRGVVWQQQFKVNRGPRGAAARRLLLRVVVGEGTPHDRRSGWAGLTAGVLLPTGRRSATPACLRIRCCVRHPAVIQVAAKAEAPRRHVGKRFLVPPVAGGNGGGHLTRAGLRCGASRRAKSRRRRRLRIMALVVLVVLVVLVLVLVLVVLMLLMLLKMPC